MGKKKHTMAKINDEVVKFIAQMELDPETTSRFEAKVSDAEKRCNDLRESISRTSAEMMKMKAAGDDTSDAYRKLEESLKSDRAALKASTKEMQGYSQALGINKMSMKELRAYSTQLKNTLNTLHKEADPKLWDKYQKELDQVNDRMRELKGGSKETGDSISGMMGQIAGGFTLASAGMKAISSIISSLKAGWEAFTTQTQVWGDWWQVTTVTLTAGWNQFIANFGQGSNVIKASIKDAMAAAREAQLLRDELFERDNSFRIMESQARAYINEQQAIAMNTSKTSEERTAALNNIIAKEEELATMKRDIAAQERTAALAELQARTSLTEDQLQIVIDQYEKNRDIIQQAQEYNELLATAERAKNEIRDSRSSYSSEYYSNLLDETQDALEAFKQKNGEAVVEIANFLRQYDLGNDDLVNAYVEATLKMQQADIDLTASKAAQARRRGSLAKQIAAEEKAAAEASYNEEKTAIDRAYNEELLLLTQQLQRRQVSQELFNAKTVTAEIEMLEKKKVLAEKYGKSTIEIERTIAAKRVGVQKAINAALDDDGFGEWMESKAASAEAAIEKMMDEITQLDDTGLDLPFHLSDLTTPEKPGTVKAAKARHDADMSDLKSQYDQKLISEEAFLEKKKELNRQYYSDLGEIVSQEGEMYAQATSQALEGIGQLVNSAKDAEISAVDAKMQKELAMAGDNAEKRKAIEERAARKKMEINKKYADAEMVINIAKTLANGAVAAMRAFSDLGPIAGGVMAGILTGITAAQVAVVVSQRNAIKNAQMSGGSDSSGSASGRASSYQSRGFSAGGYTGDGDRYEPAGIVHRGEYVVPKPMLKDPNVREMVRELERRRLSGQVPPSGKPGFVDGGYTGDGGHEEDLLDRIYKVLLDISANPLPAYLVLDEFEKKVNLRDRFKKLTSL